jgi:hypothetical protein
VLAFIDFGPEILYRTGHSVYSIPTGRFQPGFTAGYGIMTATDPEEARLLIEKAGVDLIVVCPGSPAGTMYSIESEAPTFYELLAEGEAPSFVRPLPLPDAAAAHFKVFAAGGG